MNKFEHKVDLSVRYAQAFADTLMYTYLDSQKRSLTSVINGNPYIAATFYVPSELLALFEVESIYIERISGLGAVCNLQEDINYHARHNEIPSIACSYQQFFKNLVDKDFIPSPDFFTACSFACDDAWMFGQTFSAQKKIPFYLIDVLKNNKTVALEYLTHQLNELYNILKSRYKQIYSKEEVVEQSNATLEIKNKIDTLRFRYPGIMHSSQAFKLFTVFNDYGTLAAFEVYSALLSSLEAKISTYKNKETLNILWIGVLPLYRNRLLADIEKRYNCRIVFEELFEFGNHPISIKDFYSDLGTRIVENLFYSIENRLYAIKRYNEIFNLSGVIHFSQHNCRFLPPTLPVLFRELGSCGLPIVEIAGDAINSAHFNENECYNALDAFFESIQAKERKNHVYHD